MDRVNIASNILITNNNAKPAKNINEIRELLGVEASDNLLHAKLILIVEGVEDKVCLNALFLALSPTLKKALTQGVLIIDDMKGASNIQYKISLYQAALCETHCYVDNDDAGREAIKKAKLSGILKEADYNICICKGMKNSELEDIFDVSLYRTSLETEYGIDLKTSKFKNNNKWSDRMKETYLSQGKPWDDSDEMKVKYSLAKIVEKNPLTILNIHKRTSFDALVKILEKRINQY